MRKATFIFCMLVVLLGLAGISHAQTLRVLNSAVVSGECVMVGDIARLENMSRADAEAIAQTIVIEKATARRILADEILFAIMTRSGRTDLATKIQVTGAAGCDVSLDGATPVAAAGHDQVLTATVVTPQANNAVAANSAAPGNQKLSDMIRAMVLEDLQAPADDVRVTFETVNPLLDAPASADTRWQVRAMTRVPIGTVQWEAQLWQGNRISQRFVVQARVMRRTQSIVTVKPVGRGEILFDTSAVEVQERWIDRNMPEGTNLTKVDEVLGAEAARSIPAGEVLDGRSFRKADMLQKGDMVTVWFVTNGLTIKGSARALSSAKLHDRAACRNEVSGESIEGTVIGRRIVVVGAVDARTEARLRKES